jgi:hypothetical protein
MGVRTAATIELVGCGPPWNPPRSSPPLRGASRSRTFEWTCSTWACACAAAISSSVCGAQFEHSPRSSFQQTVLHTHFPQRTHCVKFGLTSATAACNAESRGEAGEVNDRPPARIE